MKRCNIVNLQLYALPFSRLHNIQMEAMYQMRYKRHRFNLFTSFKLYEVSANVSSFRCDLPYPLVK